MIGVVEDADLLVRIAIDPKVMAGKQAIRGTRLTVEYILSRLGHDESAVEIIAEYPGLQPADIAACIVFARNAVAASSFVPFAETA